MRIFWNSKQDRTNSILIEATVEKYPGARGGHAVIKVHAAWDPDRGKVVLYVDPFWEGDGLIIKSRAAGSGYVLEIQPDGWKQD